VLSQSNLFYVAVGLTASLGVIRIWCYFKWKKDSSVTDFEKSLWSFVFVTGYFAALAFVWLLYLPMVGFFPKIDPVAPTENVIAQLVINQERLVTKLEQIRDVFYFALLMMCFYLMSVVMIVGQLLNERRKLALKNVKIQTLGLDLD